MKKSLIYLVFIWIGLTVVPSCKKHEVAVEDQPRYIVGEWKLDKLTIMGVERSLTDCHRQSYMIFEKNGKAESKYYTFYESTGECVLHLHYRGRWEFKDGKFYFYVEESNTSELPEAEEKELHFLNPDYFYIEQEYGGYSGKLYFKKI